jgi:esterase
MLHVTAHHGPEVRSDIPPLIILHGMFGAGDNWLTIARELGQERRVYTVDLPGHGESQIEHGERPFFYPNHADCLFRTLIQLPELCPAVLCGHSMGGKVAMTLALHHPEMVAGLVVVDTAPKSYLDTDFNHEVLAMLAGLDPTLASSRLEFEEGMKDYINDAVVRGFLLKSLVSNGQGGYRWRFSAQAILDGARDIADWPQVENTLIYQGLTLFIKGELSAYIDETADLPLIHAHFPEARLAVVPRARHWVHFDNKSHFVALIREFLG